MKGRENPYATPWRLRGHTYVPWAPGTCNVIGRQIVWVASISRGLVRFNGSDNKLEECRENPYATPWRLRGHTIVPWMPGTYTVIGRLKPCRSSSKDCSNRYFSLSGSERMTANPIQTVSEVIL